MYEQLRAISCRMILDDFRCFKQKADQGVMLTGGRLHRIRPRLARQLSMGRSADSRYDSRAS